MAGFYPIADVYSVVFRVYSVSQSESLTFCEASQVLY